jgi:hypothetical protein
VSNRPKIVVFGRFAVGLAAVAASLPLAAAAASAPASQPVSHVVVLAVPGLRWADLSPTRTPHLWAFAGQAARGLLAVKAAGPVASCGDAMTTLGAGNRATTTRVVDRQCAATNAAIDATDWRSVVSANRRQRYGAEPGALGRVLEAHGQGTRATGAAGATLAAGTPPVGSLAAGPPAVDVVAAANIYASTSATRTAATTAVDDYLAPWLGVPPPQTVVIVVGAGDDAHGPAGLRVAMIAGAGFGSGRLTSDSTGRTPYVELIDVAPTVLSLLDEQQPSSMVGQPWKQSSRGTSLDGDVQSFVDASTHAAKRRYWGGRFVRVMVACGAATSALGGALLLLRVRNRLVRRGAEVVCYFVSALPVSAYALQIFPWWRWSAVAGGFLIGAFAVVIGAVAFVVAQRRPPWAGVAVVALVTSVVLALDLVTGTHLQLDGLLGDSTTIAGRFHGAGNTDFAVFATAVLLVIGLVASVLRYRGRRVAVTAVVVIGVVALLLDGAPMFGDDLGGVLALAPALAVLGLLALGVRLGPRVWLAAIALGVAAGVALIGYDLVSGGGHIGRFAGEAGKSGARATIDRKLAANLGSWHRSDYVAMVGFGLFAVVISLRGPLLRAVRSLSLFGAALVAVAVCAVLGGALNDSGVVVPGASALIVVPLLLAGCLRAEA